MEDVAMLNFNEHFQTAASSQFLYPAHCGLVTECRPALVHGLHVEYAELGNCFDVHFTLPEKTASSPVPLSPTCRSAPLGPSHHRFLSRPLSLCTLGPAPHCR